METKSIILNISSKAWETVQENTLTRDCAVELLTYEAFE
jgi:hypothetical protein